MSLPTVPKPRLIWMMPVVVSVALVLAVLLAPPSGLALAAQQWTDVSDDWWTTEYGIPADQVSTVAAGYEDGTFRPYLAVSRGHFAKMAVTGLGLGTKEPATPTFGDVGVTSDLFPWVEGAAAAGIIFGYGDGTFRPMTNVARQQAGSMLGLFLSNRELRVAGHIAGDEGDYPSLAAWYAAEGAGVLAAFADTGSLSSSHAPATAYLVYRGVVRGSARSGGTYLDPLSDVTRAQAVVLVLRARDVGPAPPRSLDPFVSTAWVEDNHDMEGLVVLDVRSAADYAAGHIPGSISVPFGMDSAWAAPADEVALELPALADLFKVIGDCGISADSSVILVGGVAREAPHYPSVDTARVATTLIYAGVKNVAIMQGGHRRWAEEDRAVTIEVPVVGPAAYSGTVDADIFVTTEYVEARIGTATIVDTRSPDVYSGAAIDAAAPKPGHIPTARSLPARWLWQADGTYVPVDEMEAMAADVLGQDKDSEVIVYCTLGGSASCWWFVLTQVLGYRDVKLYDGSAHAWVKDHDMVTETGGS